MKARLFSKTGAMAGSSFVIGDKALIGRDAQCDITLYLHTISSQHARIYLDPKKNAFMLEDLGSSNGTFLDKTRVESPVALDGLHVITFARDVDMIFQIMTDELAEKLHKRSISQKSSQQKSIQQKTAGVTSATSSDGAGTQYQKGFEVPEGGLPNFGAPPEPGAAHSDPGSKTTYGQQFDALPDFSAEPPTKEGPSDDTALRTSPVSPVDDTVDRMPAFKPGKPAPEYTLAIDTVKETGRIEKLEPGMYTMGRGGQCEIVIQDEYMSGKHAAIRIDDNGPVLLDLGSRNGTFLDDEKITGEAPLKSGSVIRLGPTTKIVFSF